MEEISEFAVLAAEAVGGTMALEAVMVLFEAVVQVDLSALAPVRDLAVVGRPR